MLWLSRVSRARTPGVNYCYLGGAGSELRPHAHRADANSGLRALVQTTRVHLMSFWRISVLEIFGYFCSLSSV